MLDLGPHAAFIIAAYARDLRRGGRARRVHRRGRPQAAAPARRARAQRHQAALGRARKPTPGKPRSTRKARRMSDGDPRSMLRRFGPALPLADLRRARRPVLVRAACRRSFAAALAADRQAGARLHAAADRRLERRRRGGAGLRLARPRARASRPSSMCSPRGAWSVRWSIRRCWR